MSDVIIFEEQHQLQKETEKVSKRPAESQDENPKPEKRGKTVTYNEYYIESMEGGELVRKFYKGEVCQERMVRVEYPNGTKHFYEGDKDQEKKVRNELPDGTKHFLEGEKGQERFVRIEFPNGFKNFYEGERGQEKAVRKEFPDGNVDKYKSETLRNGETKYFVYSRYVKSTNTVSIYNISGRLKCAFPYLEDEQESLKSPEIQDCSVCLNHKSSCIFIKCGHLRICASCANDLRAKAGIVKPKCPICRVPSQIIRCYF